ncbi:hypothetical protein M407DRAFT_22471 [Tulasnella calospora MUT 4182]|uniref:Uncharacterized protein n=1 Tax=Tulasnella calospora MUT 4182 TaxID=1051891 RepID=A0A0C3M3L1_9AGAM|nr:hypothetical protein M407DRAFT_22471 [Tulasnella calospora MUT 4182]
MTLSGLWTRRLSPTESPPSAPRWARLQSKLSHRRGHEAEDPTTSLDVKVYTKKPAPERKRQLKLQIISPQPSVQPPRQPPTHCPSQDNDCLPTRTDNSSSSRSVPHDSPPSKLLSECDNDCSAAGLQADTLGATGSAECYTPSLDIKANAGEVANAVVSESQHFSSIPSSDAVRFIDRSEKTPTHELSSAHTHESFDALFQQESDEVSVCLRSAAIIKAKRRRLRAEARRARRSSPEVIIHDFSIVLNALGSIGSAEDDGPSVDNEGDQSASDEAEPSSAVAPVATTPALHSQSYESVVPAAPPLTQSATDASTGIKSHPPPRNSQDSFSSSESLFKYDYPSSNAPRARLSTAGDTVKNTPSLPDAEEVEEAGCEGSYDLDNQCVSLTRANDLGLIGSPETDGSTVDWDGGKSAAAEAESSSGVAPTPATTLSYLEPCGIVIQVTPPSPPGTIRPSQRHKFFKSGLMNLDSSRLVSEHPEAANSTSKSDRARVASRGAEIPASTRRAKNYSRPFKSDTDEGIGCRAGSSKDIANVHPSKCTASKVVVGREADGQTIDREDDTSAAAEADPSACVAPITSNIGLRRKPKKGKGFAERLLPGPLRRQARNLASSITSSMPIGPDDDLARPQSNIWNIYVKLEFHTAHRHSQQHRPIITAIPAISPSSNQSNFSFLFFNPLVLNSPSTPGHQKRV